MARVSKNRVNFSLSLPPALVQQLDKLKGEQSATRSEIIRILLEKGLASPYPWPDGAPSAPPSLVAPNGAGARRGVHFGVIRRG
jgi:hypothetical protein